MKYSIPTAIVVLSLTALSQSQAGQPAQAAPPKNPAPKGNAGKKKPVAKKNNGQPDQNAADQGTYLVSIHKVPAGKSSSDGSCALLPEAENKALTAEDIAGLIGDPAPFSVKPRGSHQLLIYSTRHFAIADPKEDPKETQARKRDQALLDEIESRIDNLAKSTKFEVELTVPHARALGDVAAKVNGLNYDTLTVEAAGTDKIRVTSDSAPDCDVWKQFLTNVRQIAWRPHPVSPVERIFYLNGSDVSTALNGAGGGGGGGNSNITVNAVGAQTSGGSDKGSGNTPNADSGNKASGSDASKKGGGAGKDTGGTDNASGGGTGGGKGKKSSAKGAKQAGGDNSGSNNSGSKAADNSGDTSQQKSTNASVGGDPAQKPPSPGAAMPATPDLLVFSEPTPGDDEPIAEKRRIVAMLDLPRPEMLVNVWSVQLSAADQETMRTSNQAVRDAVSVFNDRLQAAVLRGWAVMKMRAAGAGFYDDAFYKYIAYRHIADAPLAAGPATNQGRSQDFLDYRNGVTLDQYTRAQLGVCRGDQYCLGYSELFNPLKPRLTDLLLAVIAAADPVPVINASLNAMEDVTTSSMPEAQANCERMDRLAYNNSAGPFFECFREKANAYFRPSLLGLARSAVADFLFHYKMANQFPHEFSNYDLDLSAQSLNTVLNPLIDAFNRDITVYQTVLTDHLFRSSPEGSSSNWLTSDARTKTFLNNGMVSVRTVSGKETIVDTVTQTYLDATNAPNLSQLMNSIVQAQNSVPPVIGNNLGAAAASALVGTLNAMQPTEARIGRGLKIDLMPRSLAGASSAEIDVIMNVEETAEPTLYTSGAASTLNDNLSRVAKHNTTTKMRVDSLKIFEVSSLYAKLQRSRSRFPLLPLPGLEVPYIGTLIGIPRRPATEYHSSIAILSAIVVPTAADLAYGIRYEGDQIVGSETGSQACAATGSNVCSFRRPTSKSDLGNIEYFHRAMANCFATGFPTKVASMSGSNGCASVSFSNVQAEPH